MSRCFPSIASLVFATILAACADKDNNVDTKVAAETGTEVGSKVPAKVVTSEEPSGSARFERDIRKKGCEILTAELAGATFGVPAENLEQKKIMGCLYTWRSETEQVEAYLSGIRAHKTEADAAAWFAKTTMNKTAEQVKAEMDKVVKQVDKSEKLDTDIKKSAAKSILEMIDHKAIVFEDVESVGNEARASDDGTITVRVNNLTFNISAYQGELEPKLEIKSGDVKEITKLARKHSEEWAQKTAPQRKKDGINMAKAVVAAL